MNNIGLIIKCIGGLYTVESPDGIYECKARGVFRNNGITPYVGDKVTINEGIITNVLERKNCIIRPPLANLDQLVFIISTCSPSPNFLLLDKFIAIAEYKKIKPIIITTKVDLKNDNQIKKIYDDIGIEMYSADYNDLSSINKIKNLFMHKISALTGNSGSGKSTLLNSIDNSLNIPTAEISRKLGRGRHTTRHAELYKLADGGYIADTPGFSTFETNKYDIIRKEELADCFVEFSEFSNKCRFKDCSHTCENGCAVLNAISNGEVSKSRHQSYCSMYDEAKLLKEWELK